MQTLVRSRLRRGDPCLTALTRVPIGSVTPTSSESPLFAPSSRLTPGASPAGFRPTTEPPGVRCAIATIDHCLGVSILSRAWEDRGIEPVTTFKDDDPQADLGSVGRMMVSGRSSTTHCSWEDSAVLARLTIAFQGASLARFSALNWHRLISDCSRVHLQPRRTHGSLRSRLTSARWRPLSCLKSAPTYSAETLPDSYCSVQVSKCR